MEAASVSSQAVTVLLDYEQTNIILTIQQRPLLTERVTEGLGSSY